MRGEPDRGRVGRRLHGLLAGCVACPPIAGGNTEFGEPVPQRLQGGVRVAVERRAADALEGPARAFQDLLAGAVLCQTSGPCQRSPSHSTARRDVGPFDDDVDAVPAYRVCWTDTLR